jgi:hypothetical protein
MLSIVERLVVVVRNFEHSGRRKAERISLPPGFYDLYQEDFRDHAAAGGIKAATATSVLGVPVVEFSESPPKITFSDGSELPLHLWPD